MERRNADAVRELMRRAGYQLALHSCGTPLDESSHVTCGERGAHGDAYAYGGRERENSDRIRIAYAVDELPLPIAMMMHRPDDTVHERLWYTWTLSRTYTHALDFAP